ncbi:MAG: ribonucleoside triphosphate reductase [Candidatus Micrarchaeia archaeon]
MSTIIINEQDLENGERPSGPSVSGTETGASKVVREYQVTKVRKRDGRIVPFEREKISTAIFKAASSVGGKDRALAEKLTERVIEAVETKYAGKIPTVEEIQDIVEKVLVEGGHYKTAKAYILYRDHHARIRDFTANLLDVRSTINEYLDRTDWRVKENSNEDYSFSGLLLYTAGKVIANYTLDEIYTPQIAEAHRKGYFHIHDLSHGCVAYCAGWSLKNLLIRGFGGVPNKANAKPARHLDVVVHHMINYIGCLQMEFAGAQSFASVDTLMAPFIRADNLSYKQVKQDMQKLIFSLNVPCRWGSQYPFSNLTFDWTVPEEMKDEKAIVGGEPQNFTYGDLQPEMDMINKAFIELMIEGDCEGRVFTFPIPTYNLTKDFDWNGENTDLLFEMTAKYGLPYFQNYIGSDNDPRSIHAMCCRLNINLKELIQRPGHAFAAGDNTGSIGVVTINMNRLGYKAKNEEDFFNMLGYYMRLAKDSLEIKRRIVENNLRNGLMPYAKTYLGTFRNHFSTIGLCGMNEACLNFLKEDIASPAGKQFAIDTLLFMRDMLRDFQKETGNLYNLEATPAEGVSYRFPRIDKKLYPDIITAGGSDGHEPFLTNSTQLPVDYTNDLFFAIKHQADIQPLYTGGTVFHVFLGERTDPSSCKQLVRKIAQTRLPYISITPTYSICPSHGYISGEQPQCPQCGKETEVYSRVVGYYRPVKNWNAGKVEEFKRRKMFDYKKFITPSTGMQMAVKGC